MNLKAGSPIDLSYTKEEEEASAILPMRSMVSVSSSTTIAVGTERISLIRVRSSPLALH